MTSLHRRVLAGSTCGMAVVLAAAGVAVYAAVSRALFKEFDAALLDRAHTLAELTEQEGDHIDLEFEEADLSAFSRQQDPEYFELWLADGTPAKRSPSLDERDLDRTAMTPGQAVACVLPDGRPGRCILLEFILRRDSEVVATAPPWQVALALARDTTALDTTLVRLRIALIGVGALATVAAALVLVWVVRLGLRPAADLAERIAEIDEQRLARRIEPATLPEELRPIVARLNDLLERLAAAFRREQTLTASIAHELRTPIAGLRSVIEVSVSRHRDGPAYRQALEDCLRICIHTQLIVDNILAIARLDARQLPVTRGAVEVDVLLRRVWADFAERAADRDLEVAWTVDRAVVADTDDRQLELVLRNLFDNAVHYTDRGGHIDISATESDDSALISVSNSGSRITPGDGDRVFERFWRGDDARQQDTGRCGLGLPLCRLIVEQLGGRITADTNTAGRFAVAVHLQRCANGAPALSTRDAQSSSSPSSSSSESAPSASSS